MGEIVALVAVSSMGAAVLARRTQLPGVPVTLLGPVVGVACYVSAAAALLAVVDRADPPMVLGVTLAGLAAATIARGAMADRAVVLGALASGAFALGVGGFAAAADATRLSPDSLSYLAVADIIAEPDAMERLRPFTVAARNLTTGALHTFGVFSGEPYAEVVTPLVTGAGAAFMLWALAYTLRSVDGRVRALLVASAATVTLAGGRTLYDAFFVNSHGPIMAWFFALVCGAYLMVEDDRPGWGVVIAVCAPPVLVARPEGPLLVAIALLPLLTSRMSARRRVWIAVPSALVALAWFGAAAVAHPGLLALDPAQPVLPAVIVSLGLVAVGALPPTRTAAWLPWVAAAALALVAAGGAVADPEMFSESLEATAVNLTGSGGWGLTWPVLIALSVLALSLDPVPGSRLLVAPIAGFVALLWASPVLRDVAYRVGTGDSGSRMLAHVFLVVLFWIASTVGQASVARASRSSAV
jgi:hypothetical protein